MFIFEKGLNIFRKKEVVDQFAEAYEIYKEFIKKGIVNPIENYFPIKSENDFREEIDRIWDKVADELRERGFEPSEETRKRFSENLDNNWGMKNVGWDY